MFIQEYKMFNQWLSTLWSISVQHFVIDHSMSCNDSELEVVHLIEELEVVHLIEELEEGENEKI